MRIKYADMSNKNIVTKKSFSYKEIDNEKISAYISLLITEEVKENWFVPRKNNRQDQVLGNGYKWLGIYLKNKKYAITVIYNEKNEFVEVYFDMIKSVGIKNNIPYMDDLYLDIVITKELDKYILDEDELKEALDNKVISKEDYDLAYKTLSEIDNTYKTEEDLKKLLDMSDMFLKELS